MKMEKINTHPAESEAAATERLLESVEDAQRFYATLKEFDGTDVVGADQLAIVEGAASELTEVLKSIPAAECIANGLPFHPTDEKYEHAVVPFPSEPDYPLDYEPQASGAEYPERYPRADELPAA